MSKDNIQVNVFLKYVISYSIVLILPVLVFFWGFYPYVMSILTNKVMEGNQEVVAQVENAMTLQFQNIYKIPAEISNNKSLAKYNLLHDEYSRMMGVEEIAKYLNTNSFVFNALLYWRGEDKVFSNRTIFALTDIGYKHNFYYYPQWSREDFMKVLNTVVTAEGPIVRPAEPVYYYGTKYNLITYIFSLPRTLEVSSGTLMIFVEEKTIHQLIKSSSSKYHGNIIVVSDKGDIITSLKKDEYVYSEKVREMVKGISGKGSEIYNLDGVDYIVSYTKAQNEWKYLSLIPLISAQKELKTLKLYVLIVSSIILLLEALIIYMAMKTNYYPIKSLVNVAQEVIGTEKLKGSNEFDMIRTALKSISLKDFNEWKEAETNREDLSRRNSLLYEILNGNIKALERLRERQVDVGIEFLYKTFCVSIISLHTENRIDSLKLKEFLVKYEGKADQGVQLLFLTNMHTKKIITICSQQNKKVLDNYLHNLREKLGNQFSCQVFIGIGDIKEDLMDLHQSYIEAFEATDYLDMKKANSIIFYSDLPSRNTIDTSFPADSIYLLDFAVLKSDVLQIRGLISSITETMKDEKTPIYMIRSIYYSVINILIKGLLKFEALEDESKLNIANSTFFIDSCTANQLISLIQETADKVCELMIDSSRIIRNSLIEEVLEFIEENYLSPDFSIRYIAEHFNMTVSNFSHYFKNNTQKNFKMYVDHLRIDKAKELLENTSQSIEEVAKKVCYSNASNFSRHFKKMVGTTPGEYRKSHSS